MTVLVCLKAENQRDKTMHTARGVILRLTKLTDTSWIVTWCVEGRGLVKTVAKGARRAKSQFSGKLDLFYTAELGWVESKKSELHTLREVVVSDYAEGIRKSYKNTMVAGYFASLVEYVMEDGHAEDDVFSLLVRAYQYLSENDAEERAVVHFEKELAKLLGIWDGSSAPDRAIKRAFGGLPKNRESCMVLFE